MNPEKFQNKYRVPSARATWHDYNGGDYFITICTAGRLHYFGEIENGEMHKNVLGHKLDELIQETKTHNPYSEIPLYKIMPNHVHLIVCIDAACRDAACHVFTGEPGKNEKMRDIANRCGLLSTVIGGLKSALTKYANLNKIKFGWQSRFHDHIIRNQEEMERIVIYIENNVLSWEMDKFYTRYTTSIQGNDLL
ncbi:MAG: hypothetical protein PHH37_07695 [Paludibacter sp.]|nr:hypothetical protein [Paludibacter sp.]